MDRQPDDHMLDVVTEASLVHHEGPPEWSFILAALPNWGEWNSMRLGCYRCELNESEMDKGLMFPKTDVEQEILGRIKYHRHRIPDLKCHPIADVATETLSQDWEENCLPRSRNFWAGAEDRGRSVTLADSIRQST